MAIEPQIEIPPTADELPYDDGEPMASHRHVQQLALLVETLNDHWAARDDVFVGGNMFLYFSLEQVKHNEFRGPDVLVVQGVPRRDRKSWVVWQEGKGPDVVIELLSATTATVDRGEKKQVYQDQLRVPEYFWFDPYTHELAGFRLVDGRYEPIEPDARGALVSRQLGLLLVRWNGIYRDIETEFLRWATSDGTVLPTGSERARAESERAEQERERAERLAARLRALGVDPDQV